MEEPDELALTAYLLNNGLHDTEYWLQQLAKLNVRSIEAFKYMEEGMGKFCELQKKARSPEERKILYKLLKIDFDSENKERKQELQMLKRKRNEAVMRNQRQSIVSISSDEVVEEHNRQEKVDSQVEPIITAEGVDKEAAVSDIAEVPIGNSNMNSQVKEPVGQEEVDSQVEQRITAEEVDKTSCSSQAAEQRIPNNMPITDSSVNAQIKDPIGKEKIIYSQVELLNTTEEVASSQITIVEQKIPELRDSNASVQLTNLEGHQGSNTLQRKSNDACEQQSVACSLKTVLQTEIYQHKVEFEDHSSILENNQKYNSLKRLGLCNHYPKKLQMQDALCMCSQFSASSRQLYNLILQKLMAFDFLCRSDLMPVVCDAGQHQSPSSSPPKPLSPSSSSSSLASLLSLSSSSLVLDDSADGINPVDGIIALIICSDDFLRQDLLSRMAKCQLAVPFILPDPLTQELTIPLWAMRSITKEWKSIDGNQTTYSLVSSKVPIVSFVRFGKHQKHSKSKILNEVISDSHYDHFFHRDCRGGHYNVLLGDGLVDMCWFLPKGSEGDIFSKPVSFLNLHGDARKHPQQISILSKISSMFFVLLTGEDLECSDQEFMEVLKILSSTPGGITILAEMKSAKVPLEKEISNMHTINLSQKNMPLITDEILKAIKTSMTAAHFCCIEKVVEINGTIVDEHHGSCKEGLRLAKAVKETFQLQNFTSMLPLQSGGFWKTWAAMNREEYQQTRRGKKNVTDYAAKIKDEKERKQKEHLKHIESLTPMITLFIESLLALGGSNNKTLRNIFLQSLKLELNRLSSKNLSELQNTYNSFNQLILNQFDNIILSTEEIHKKKMLQDQILNSTFGLEHLLREVGQMYEVVMLQSSDYEEDALRLPKAAAELFVDGWPLEIMDGDASHVPLYWITAILQEAAKMLGDPKVFVLSVLGLQSTGKSTLLNTVFGLQFNVGAGRCTRGVFMQLLPLDEELKKETKCSYVLVVDTEGLRAPAFDPQEAQRHDNELATFVIGLANMTFINIYGEVPGDMDDILQTSVHAFLRMKEVNLTLSCQFVHQNCISSFKAEIGGSKFIKKLDYFTLLAAKEECCEGIYTCFNDVIKFNEQTDVHHFPALWKGDPPMAPVNEGYSHAAQKIKQYFIKVLKESSPDDCSLTLTCLHDKIDNLWTSLLKEDFVFSFKNTLEIIAYKKLESEWSSKWRWPFHQKMLEWERQAENEITAEKYTKSINSLVQEKRKMLEGYVSNTLQEIQADFDSFFDKNQNAIYLQLKPRFQRMLDYLASELKQHAENRCVLIGESRRAIVKYERELTEHTEMVRRGVREHNMILSGIKKGQLSEKQLEEEFDELWKKLIVKVPVASAEPIDVEGEVTEKLLGFRAEYRGNLMEKLSKHSLKYWGQKQYNPQNDIGRAPKCGLQSSDFNQLAQQVTGDILGEAKKIMDKMATEKHFFNSALTLHLLRSVANKIDDEKTKMADHFLFTRQYRVQVFLNVCGKAVQKFEEMVEDFKELFDPRLYLEKNVKSILFIQFKNQCCKIETEAAIANTLCAVLKEPIIEQIKWTIGPQLVGEMKNQYPYFRSKMALKAKILTDLRERDNFDDYMDYVLNVEQCLEEWIKIYTLTYCDTTTTGGNTRLQEKAKHLVLEHIEMITNEATKMDITNIYDWLLAFCNNKTLCKQLGLNLDPGNLLDGYDPSYELNLETFNESIKVQLEILKNSLHKFFNNFICGHELDNWREDPVRIVKADLVGCTEQCPFCAEQCDLLDLHAGDHRTAIHRPDCIRGYRYLTTRRMAVDFCHDLIIADEKTFKPPYTKNSSKRYLYKEYKQVYPNWYISPGNTSQDCLYWKWFVAKYRHQIARRFDAIEPIVPTEWQYYSKSQLIKYLNHVYCVHHGN